MDDRERQPNPAPEERQQGKKEKKKGGLLRRLGTLLLILAVVLAAAVLTTMEDGRHFATLRRWLMYGDTGEDRSLYAYASDPANRFGRLGEDLLLATPRTIQLLREDGTAAYDLQVNLSAPSVSVGGRQAAVCDIGGGSLYLVDERGLLREMETGGGLCYYSARLNGQDYLAVTEQKSGYKASVSVYDSGGELLFHFDSYDSYISDAMVTEDCRSLVAVSLEPQGGAFASSILVYDLTGAELVSSRSIRDGLVLDLAARGDKVLSLCDTRLAITDLHGNLVLDYPYTGLYLHDFALTGEDFCALLLGKYQSGNVCELISFGLDGTELGRLELTEEVLDLSAAGEYLAVLYSDSLVIYTRTLEERSRLEGTGYAGEIITGKDGTVLVLSGTTAWRYLP